MQSPEPPDPDEHIVQASYEFPIEHGDVETLRDAKGFIRDKLRQKGYEQTDFHFDASGGTPFAMTFEKTLLTPTPGHWWKIKEKLGLTTRKDFEVTHHLKTLGRVREDIPFTIHFRFKPSNRDGREFFELHIESTPMVIQQYRQGVLGSYDTTNIVHTSKQEIRQLIDKMGLKPLRRPYTQAELLQPTLEPTLRDRLENSEYGRATIQYIDEADKSLQRRYVFAALNCYILGIEWAIISYFNLQNERDLIEEGMEERRHGYYFGDLVNILEDDDVASQTTIDSLGKIGETERHWMAHHKSGEITREDIQPIKKRLGVLLEELFD